MILFFGGRGEKYEDNEIEEGQNAGSGNPKLKSYEIPNPKMQKRM